MIRCPSGDRYCNRFRESGTESLCCDCEEDARLGAWALGQIGLIVTYGVLAVFAALNIGSSPWPRTVELRPDDAKSQRAETIDVLHATLSPVRR